MRGLLLLLWFALFGTEVRAQNAQASPGLRLTWRAGDAAHTATAANIALYVAPGQSATPFLPAGPFTARWEGSVNADLRGDFTFQAQGRGSVKLELNNLAVLDAPALDGKITSKTVRLNKGANAISLTYSSPRQGAAQLRLLWNPRADKPMPHEPIRGALLTHSAAAQVAPSAAEGLDLFLQARCAKCHTPPASAAAPELAMDAPALDGIGARRHFAWLQEWILNPHGQRAGAKMPKMFHGPDASGQAEATAAFLATLSKDARAPAAAIKPYAAPAAVATAVENPAATPEGEGTLLHKFHCNACHNLPGEKPDAKKLSLDHLTRKFPPQALTDFLLAPERHYAWTRMPNFRLTPDEAAELARLLVEKLPQFKLPGPPVDPAVIARGKQLVATTGCLNCHSLTGMRSELAAPTLAQLAASRWDRACLAERPAADAKTPHYSFTVGERAALAAFGATDRKAVERHAAADSAGRQVRRLNCAGCHGSTEGIPALDPLGEKLRPEWTRDLFSGTLPSRPRPWMMARMPAFPAPSALLAHGLAATHGLPPQSPATPAVDAKVAEQGRKLVGVEGGFSCVACHGVKNVPPLQVFEAQGVSFSLMGARLQPDWYVRWMLDPLRVDPQTRMPDYFDEDARSVLLDMMDGDALRQIEAVLQYLRQGEKMALPVMR